MKASAPLGFATYNPDLVDRDGFVAQFVARVATLDRLVEDLREPKPQHHLLVGQRGMGKSTLLRRLHIAVDDDAQLRGRWLPLSFPEEQWGVAHLSDFWVNCIDAASDALAARGEDALVRSLDAAVDALAEQAEPTRAKAALKLLQSVMKKAGVGLVLLVDNFDVVLDRLDDRERWSLRKTLGQERMVLVGASVAAPAAAIEHGQAFYDWFKLDELRGLSDAETMDVLRRLADARNAPRVKKVLDEDPGRVRALHVLTGGNPRTIVLLHDMLARDDVTSVEQDLAGLLDHCTPLYKARFEELPTQAQQVVNDLALTWAPTTAADAARRLRMDVKLVSAQLDRLVKMGVVEKVPHPGGRLRFQIGERFFNIWYLMRASRRTRRKLLWLVEFLRVFYGDDAVRGRAREYLAPPMPAPAMEREHHVALLRALSDVVDDHGLRSALDARAVEALVDTSELRRRIGEIVDLGGEDATLGPKIDRSNALREMSQRVAAAKVKLKGPRDPEGFWRLLGGAASLDLGGKRRIAEGLAKMPGPALKKLIEQLEQEEARWAAGERTRHLSEALRCGVMAGPEDVEGAAVAVQRFGAGLVDEAISRRLAAGVEADELLKIGEYLPHARETEVWSAWLRRAIELGLQSQRFEAWVAYANRDGSFWDSVYLDVISDDDLSERLSTGTGSSMARALVKAILVGGLDDTFLWRTLSRHCLNCRDYQGSFDALERLSSRNEMTEDDWLLLGEVSIILRRYEQARQALERVLEANPAHVQALQSHAFASFLAPHGGDLQGRLKAVFSKSEDPHIGLVLGALEVVNGRMSGYETIKNVACSLERPPFAFLACTVLVDCHGAMAARACYRRMVERWGVRYPFMDAAIHALEGHGALALKGIEDAFESTNEGDRVPDVDSILVPLRVFVRLGHASALLGVVEKTVYGEEWLPLTQALRVLAEPEAHAVADLPVELRSVTVSLVELLSQPPPVDASKHPPSPTQRKPSAERSRRSVKPPLTP